MDHDCCEFEILKKYDLELRSCCERIAGCVTTVEYATSTTDKEMPLKFFQSFRRCRKVNFK